MQRCDLQPMNLGDLDWWQHITEMYWLYLVLRFAFLPRTVIASVFVMYYLCIYILDSWTIFSCLDMSVDAHRLPGYHSSHCATANNAGAVPIRISCFGDLQSVGWTAH